MAADASDTDDPNPCRLREHPEKYECERREWEGLEQVESEQQAKIAARERHAEFERRIARPFAKRVSEANCGDASEQCHHGLMSKIGTEPATEHPVAVYK